MIKTKIIFYFFFINFRNSNFEKIYNKITKHNANLPNKYPKFLQKDQHNTIIPNKYPKFLQKDQHKLKLQYPPYSI